MVRNKERFCPHCNAKMKFRGSRVWFCRTCKKSFHYYTDVEYEKNEDGTVKKGIFGKPKVKHKKQKMKTWATSR